MGIGLPLPLSSIRYHGLKVCLRTPSYHCLRMQITNNVNITKLVSHIGLYFCMAST